ncbi:MAG: winged helix-turn-helix transcriptional regulator [Elusimicrobia bacterium]|nr:winged helix-turn-helix transcriptional regulator [Elusimicrobiota bacterium]
MKKEIEQKYYREAEIMKALAHPTRLFILHSLKDGEKCVCELTDEIGDDISTVSKHLLILKNAGLVEANRKKNWMYYKLSAPCVLDIGKCVINKVIKKKR